MKKVAIYGGTFNPLHNGHIVGLQTLVDSHEFSEVHVMLSGVPPFKPEEESMKQHRIRMCEIGLKPFKQVVLNQLEINEVEVSYTYHSLQELSKDQPDTKFYWVIGYDNLFSIEAWRQGDKLLSEFNFVVLNRGGYDEVEANTKINELKRKYGCEFIKIVMPNIEIASSSIRKRISNNQSVYGYIPEVINTYIEKQGLYKS